SALALGCSAGAYHPPVAAWHGTVGLRQRVKSAPGKSPGGLVVHSLNASELSPKESRVQQTEGQARGFLASSTERRCGSASRPGADRPRTVPAGSRSSSAAVPE